MTVNRIRYARLIGSLLHNTREECSRQRPRARTLECLLLLRLFNCRPVHSRGKRSPRPSVNHQQEYSKKNWPMSSSPDEIFTAMEPFADGGYIACWPKPLVEHMALKGNGGGKSVMSLSSFIPDRSDGAGIFYRRTSGISGAATARRQLTQGASFVYYAASNKLIIDMPIIIKAFHLGCCLAPGSIGRFSF